MKSIIIAAILVLSGYEFATVFHSSLNQQSSASSAPISLKCEDVTQGRELTTFRLGKFEFLTIAYPELNRSYTYLLDSSTKGGVLTGTYVNRGGFHRQLSAAEINDLPEYVTSGSVSMGVNVNPVLETQKKIKVALTSGVSDGSLTISFTDGDTKEEEIDLATGQTIAVPNAEHAITKGIKCSNFSDYLSQFTK